MLNERNFDITRVPLTLDELLSGRAFRGAGQEFRLEAVPGTQFQRYTASFREPYLFDSQYSLGTSGYYYTRGYNEYDEQRFGGRVVLGRKFGPNWSANVAFRAEDVEIYNVPYYFPTDITQYIGSHSLFGARASVTRDTRDSYLRPTEGSQRRTRATRSASAATRSRCSASRGRSTSRPTSGPTAAAGTCWRSDRRRCSPGQRHADLRAVLRRRLPQPPRLRVPRRRPVRGRA